MTVALHHGDMREVLARLKGEGVRVQSVVTDPPYHLTSIVKRFGGEGATAAMAGTKANHTGAYARASRGFMGKQWDGGDIAFQAETWRLCWELLPPGGHLVAFSGTRTYHRMACAIEDAGFEIRDMLADLVASDAAVQTFMASLNEEQCAAFLRCIAESGFGGMLAWLYGSGFPKSHDVSKGIDKMNGDPLAWQTFAKAYASAVEKSRLSHADIDRALGIKASSCYWARLDHRGGMPPRHHWDAVRVLLSLPAEYERLYLEAEREIVATGRAKGKSRGVYGDFAEDEYNYTAPASDLAKQWEGWGTALKPAIEPICFARKPLEGTVAANVLKHGTGAINVDGCRIHAVDAQAQAYTVKRLKPGATLERTGGSWRPDDGVEDLGETKPGRWPANVVHDGSDEVVAAFPVAGGAQRAVTGAERAHRTVNADGAFNGSREGMEPRGDTGSAARFFYSSKADAGDRLGSKHPTVKPVDLMRWLVRLVTPPGGTVLDPFAGSGTTGMACLAEGFDCILVEREAEYVADIRRRIAHVSGADTPLFSQGAA